MKEIKLYERIHELAMTRSIFIPSNEPYGSVAGFYDYGPVGKLINNRIEQLFRRMFVREEAAHEIETSIITPEIVLKASGHVESFADPVVECKSCKSKIRADSFVEETTGKKWDGKLPSLDAIIKDKKLFCPSCKKGMLGFAGMSNLMFATWTGGEKAPAYARPETAQGIFVDFIRLFRNHGAKLPLAIAQIGKSFRNEISPRKGLVRMREFRQMELEYFFNPSQGKMQGFDKIAKKKMRMKLNGKIVEKTAQQLVKEKIAANEIMAYFLAKEWDFYLQCGLDPKRMHFRVLGDEERPHYSQSNIDLEVETSHGIVEINGNAYRSSYDLSRHAALSKKDFSVFVEEEKKKIVPHVFEVSMGVDRLLFCILEHTFRERSKEKEWEWFDLPPVISPYQCAVFPLMKKDGLAEKAQGLYAALRSEFDVFYYASGSIGRRYAKADEIGLAYALTVDYDTLKDDTVTIRYRNDGKQERIKIADAMCILKENQKRGRMKL